MHTRVNRSISVNFSIFIIFVFTCTNDSLLKILKLLIPQTSCYLRFRYNYYSFPQLSSIQNPFTKFPAHSENDGYFSTTHNRILPIIKLCSILAPLILCILANINWYFGGKILWDIVDCTQTSLHSILVHSTHQHAICIVHGWVMSLIFNFVSTFKVGEIR